MYIVKRCTILVLHARDSERVQRYGNHLSSIKCEPFGNIIVNKSDVELWVRRAQAAVLNSQRPSSEFYNMSVDHLRELSNNKFSKNVVQINVKDPEVTDLSFVDLPGSYPFKTDTAMIFTDILGLIQNAEDHLIETVRDLVEHYIAEQNTLIVIAMPLTG